MLLPDVGDFRSWPGEGATALTARRGLQLLVTAMWISSWGQPTSSNTRLALLDGGVMALPWLLETGHPRQPVSSRLELLTPLVVEKESGIAKLCVFALRIYNEAALAKRVN
jgi:hypothetical protein